MLIFAVTGIFIKQTTSEISGFSEPKLEKPCISEFRKTKSEKPRTYKEEKRSISESEETWFFCISRFVTKVSDF